MSTPIDDGGGAPDVRALCSHLGVARVRALSDGGEADLALVEDARGARYALKHYRPGFAVDPGVHERLRGINHTAVLRIHRSGVFQGRHFELADYFADRSLADRWDREPLDADALRALVRHVGSGLDVLHRAGIVHRDLKPANLLVHHDPLAPVIADFGVSRPQEHTQVVPVVEGTARYEPPEAHEGVVSAAGDWWALGMIVYELATGEHPFAGHTDREIVMTLAAWSPDGSGLPREVRRLCEGLLALDQRERWDWARVSAWLDGGERPPATRAVPVAMPDGAGIPFAGEVHTSKKGFADAVRDNWGLAERRFLTDMRTAYGLSEGWSMLRDWLRRFRSTDDADAERLVDLIDRRLTDDALEPGVKLLHLLRWLDPEGTPVFNGSPITVPKLVEACVGDLTGERRPRATAQRVLRDRRIQQLLADFPGLERLRRVNAETAELGEAWGMVVLRANLRSEAFVQHDKADTPRWTLKYLAVLAGGENEALHRLAGRSPAPPREIQDVFGVYLREAAAADEERRARGRSAVFVSMVKILFGHRGFRDSLLRKAAEHRNVERNVEQNAQRTPERNVEQDYSLARLVALQTEFRAGERDLLSERARREAGKRFRRWYMEWTVPTLIGWVLVSVLVPPFNKPAFFLLVLYGAAAAVGCGMRARRCGGAYRPPESLWKYAVNRRSYPKPPGRTVPLWVLVPLALITMLATAIHEPIAETAAASFMSGLVAVLWLGDLAAAVALALTRSAWNEGHRRSVADFQKEERRLLAALPAHLRDRHHPVEAVPDAGQPGGRPR
ncbi:hypothetical protein BJF79_26835 [Actinomadura sp. CNU-125]|uniref:serine/threonine protein kinase n=1 Tax=Actinomadura sp. CNU-125 TaxID=1904961 RepID=UPI00095CD411|nr:protein kinase [Actinomadura sp. CNU-125]OLT38456.1 hypothetical protein BJF79_26835 [Actinomadura sp. CNU-125]